MNSLVWIRLLAYRERTLHRQQRERERLDAPRTVARRGRIMAELRLALTHTIERDMDDARSSLTLASDGSTHGFVVADGDGSPRALHVALAGQGADCTYDLGTGRTGHAPAPAVRVVFASSGLLPASVVGQSETRTFASMKGLAMHLLQPLLARPIAGTSAR
jgi:hypothetical protein